MSKKISAVMFDFDGVLIDSLPAMKKAWESVQIQFNLDIDFDEYSRFIGIPFNQILNELNVKDNLQIEIASHYSAQSRRHINSIKLNPYARKILLWLKNRSIVTGIVTSKERTRTLELIRFFGIDTNIVVTPENTFHGKPHPEPLAYVANRINIMPREILFIGDMNSDMKCASNFKCKYLHYTRGYQVILHQSYGGALDSLLDIKEYILSL